MAGLELPPYPHDRLTELRAVAEQVPGGIVDCSVGTPIDPMPAPVVRALTDAAPRATGYPASIGSVPLREAALGWIGRRFGIEVPLSGVVACVGTKELVASLPRVLSLRDPSRDTVLYPAIAYPTYEMGAVFAGLRPVPVPLDDEWRLDLSQVDPEDARRALVLWINEPGNPTGAGLGPEGMQAAVAWAREHGIIVASDECYAEFTWDDTGRPARPVTALAAGVHGVLAVHSLSKRSNMAGLRAGFVAGDERLVSYLGEIRKHAGMMVPAPVQAAAAVALGDDDHVAEQRDRYAARRSVALAGLRAAGFEHEGGTSTFYLWLRGAGDADGWAAARRLADAGLLVAPGDLYGPGGSAHVRLSLTVEDDALARALGRLAGAATH